MSGPGEAQSPITALNLHRLRESARQAVRAGDPKLKEFVDCVADPLMIIALVDMLERGATVASPSSTSN